MTQKEVVSIQMDPVDPINASLRVIYADGTTSILSGGLQEARDRIAQLDTPEMVENMILAYWLARSPDGSSTQPAIGNFTLDPSAQNMFRKQ